MKDYLQLICDKQLHIAFSKFIVQVIAKDLYISEYHTKPDKDTVPLVYVHSTKLEALKAALDRVGD